jgi:hypothetical protein
MNTLKLYEVSYVVCTKKDQERLKDHNGPSETIGWFQFQA